MDTILFLQSADGSWGFHEEFAKQFGIPLATFVSALSEQGKEREWATALVIIFLRQFCAIFREVWELIVEKAEKYLEQNDSLHFLNMATDFFSKNKPVQ